jgi:leucyl aminopeptidase
MPSVFETLTATPAISIAFATTSTWEAISAALPEPSRLFARANGFKAKPGAYLALPDANGEIAQVVFGLDNETAKFRDPFRPGQLPGLLPPGVYRFANVAPDHAHLATLAFALGCYRFGRYRNSEPPEVRLVPPDGVDIADLTRMANAAALARDLINTPANDMGPAY